MATWTDFLDAVKMRGAVPTASGTFTSARFLALADATMRSKVLPLVDRLREGYFSYDVDVPNVAPFVYQIHPRAAAAKLLNAALVRDTERLDLPRYYEDELLDTTQPRTWNYGFYLKRSQIYVLGQPSEWPTFRQTIMLRPGALVTEANAAQVTGIAGKILTCSTVPSAWSNTSLFDVVQGAGHFDTLGINLAVTAVTTGTGGTVELVDDPPSRLQVGDWVSLAGQTPVIQLPEEVIPLYAQLCANLCFQSQGDKSAVEIGRAEAKDLTDALTQMMSPRVQEEGKKLVNRTGLLRRGL